MICLSRCLFVQFIFVQAAPVLKYFCTLCPCSGCPRVEIFMYSMSLFRLSLNRNVSGHYVPVQSVPVQKYLCTLCPCSGCPRPEIFLYTMSLFRLSSTRKIFLYTMSLFRLSPCRNNYEHYVPGQAVPVQK
jgi:hypothetical protein